MNYLFTPLKIKNISTKNRICVPPMVTQFSSIDSGEVAERTIEHYRAFAKGGAGLIIQEATCINKDGRLMDRQLGIWDDAQIPGLKKIVDAVHQESCPIFVQIHHAGLVGISEEPLCPSNYKYVNNNGVEVVGHEMTLEDIHRIQKDFIQAGKRAYKAGYDGIELHGCHRYLICQFFNHKVNHRKDEYGLHTEKFTIEIVNEIRKETSNDFIIGIRLGGFEPTLEDAVKHALVLEQNGIDFLDISYGFDLESKPFAPKDYPFKDIMYAAKKIKESVSIPVFAANGITSAEMAEEILEETKVDIVDIGRGFIINPNWANDAQEGRDTGRCLHCKNCKPFNDFESCIGKILFKKQHTKI